MGSFFSEIAGIFTNRDAEKWGFALLWLGGGLIVGKIVSMLVFSVLSRSGRAEVATLARRISFYGVLFISILGSLKELGVDLSVMLGAAGVLTVALGFASQTSASNVISGLFLIGERPFVAGDVIRIGETVGCVLSIDVVSIKLRTFDNLLVRIPNETLFKSEIWNLTHYPIRRYTFYIYFHYDQDLTEAREVLQDIARDNPHVLDEPGPLIMVSEFKENSVKMQYSVWGTTKELVSVYQTIYEDLGRTLKARGIKFGMPRSEVHIIHETENFDPTEGSNEVVTGTLISDHLPHV